MRVLVLIPTTGGLLQVRSLKPRAGLPASAAFADGDYRPLPWSADYARLSAPGGPLAAISDGTVLIPHELRLSRSFDTGRSWEVPVSLAHGLLARGHAIVADPAEADLVLWATGAVDLDLALIPGDYALLDKAELTREVAAQAGGVPLAVLMPPGKDRAEATATLSALWGPGLVSVIEAETIGAALERLIATETQDPAISDLDLRQADVAAKPPRSRATLWIAGVVVLGGVAVATGFALTRPSSSPAPAPKPDEQAFINVVPPQPPPAPPRLVVEALIAPKESSCRRIAFGADAPERRKVATADTKGSLNPLPLTADLCGLAFRPSGGAADIVTIGHELEAVALPPNTGGDGTVTIMLREDIRRNVVYSAQVSRRDGSDKATVHQELRVDKEPPP